MRFLVFLTVTVFKTYGRLMWSKWGACNLTSELREALLTRIQGCTK